jgi:hypothetical protein
MCKPEQEHKKHTVTRSFANLPPLAASDFSTNDLLGILAKKAQFHPNATRLLMHFF